VNAYHCQNLDYSFAFMTFPDGRADLVRIFDFGQTTKSLVLPYLIPTGRRAQVCAAAGRPRRRVRQPSAF
jgi:hypothetical protein